jgi:antitoxin-like ribbon-helix-helix protein
MARAELPSGARRKLIEFDAETWRALHTLALDRMSTIQELADEAFADLLKKHHRPVTLKEALSESAGEQPHQQHRKARKKNARASRI